jgi:nuclear RNA export factor
MDGPARGRGKIGKSTAGAAGRGGGRDAAGKTSRGGILSSTAQRHILRQAANGDVTMKGARAAPRQHLVELKVTGWEKSSSSTNKDRGVSALTSWLEKKASRKLGSTAGRREVRIRKVRLGLPG